MAVVNSNLLASLLRAGINVEKIDTSSHLLAGTLSGRLLRGIKILKGYARLIFLGVRSQKLVLYVSVSGGLGKVYEIFFVLIGRFFGGTIFLHHHSFLYFDYFKWNARLLALSAGKYCNHVVLSRKMGEKLQLHYGKDLLFTTISNIAFFPPALFKHIDFRLNLKSIGFLGNIEEAKGIFEFLGIAKIIGEWNPSIEFKIVGPYRDNRIKDIVSKELLQLDNVKYLGPKFAEEKIEFLRSIDLLLYPTHNDAEPLTILEAMSVGLPVISSAKGCIPELLDGCSGVLIKSNEDFLLVASNHIKEFIKFPFHLEKISKCTYNRFIKLHDKSTLALKDLVHKLMMA
jgi:glycosyltransferase involved in cell wall biosynthesis